MKPSKDLDEQIEKIMTDYGIDFYEGNLMHREKERLSLIADFKLELLSLIEQREREARIDELEGFMDTMVVTHGDEPARSVSTAKIRERIEALKDGK